MQMSTAMPETATPRGETRDGAKQSTDSVVGDALKTKRVTALQVTGESKREPIRERWRTVLDDSTAWLPPRMPTAIVVPHPDDEVLITGALIRLQRDRHVPVRILAVTDGEAAYDDEGIDDVERRRLGSRRRREQLNALEALGVGRAAVDRLGFLDGSVSDNLTTLSDWIASEYSDHMVVAPWVHDVHPDHEACGRAAKVACALTGSPLVYGFFWTWHHGDPEAFAGRRLQRLDLSASGAAEREAAIGHHLSQLERLDGRPVLPASLLEPIRWNAEYYLDGSPGSSIPFVP